MWGIEKAAGAAEISHFRRQGYNRLSCSRPHKLITLTLTRVMYVHSLVEKCFT